MTNEMSFVCYYELRIYTFQGGEIMQFSKKNISFIIIGILFIIAFLNSLRGFDGTATGIGFVIGYTITQTVILSIIIILMAAIIFPIVWVVKKITK